MTEISVIRPPWWFLIIWALLLGLQFSTLQMQRESYRLSGALADTLAAGRDLQREGFCLQAAVLAARYGRPDSADTLAAQADSMVNKLCRAVR